jgi:hypothetical protein
MIAYCNNDIVLLEKLYFKLRVWHQTHPDLRPLLFVESVCPTCQSTRVQFNGGLKVTKRIVKPTISMRRLRCDDDDSYQGKN